MEPGWYRRAQLVHTDDIAPWLVSSVRSCNIGINQPAAENQSHSERRLHHSCYDRGRGWRCDSLGRVRTYAQPGSRFRLSKIVSVSQNWNQEAFCLGVCRQSKFCLYSLSGVLEPVAVQTLAHLPPPNLESWHLDEAV